MRVSVLSRHALRVVLLSFVATPALACGIYVPFDITAIRNADAVLVATVTDYSVTGDLSRRRMSDYAVFSVDEVEMISGDIPMGADGTMNFAWDASTFAEPEGFDIGGRFVFALWRAQDDRPRKDVSVRREPRTDLPTLLQLPCSGAFVFREDSPEARAIRTSIETGRDLERELQIELERSQKSSIKLRYSAGRDE